MAINLQKGQRISLEKSMRMALVGLGWDTNKYDGGFDFDLDASAFLLGANGKCIKDEDFVFYNNLSGRDGAVVHQGDNLTGEGEGDDEVIIIDFAKLPPEIEKIAICVTIHDAANRRQNFGQVSRARINLDLIWRRNSPSRQLLWYVKSTSTMVTGNSMPLHPDSRAVWKLWSETMD